MTPRDDIASRVRETYQTPAGELSTSRRAMPGTVWTETHRFSGPQDYDALE
jgi:hypothetical protein